MGSAVITTTNAAWPWTNTSGQTVIQAEAIGGGGGGGGENGFPSGGGGGKGGSYARVTITKGAESTLNITVGALGAAGAGGNGGDGTASTIVQNGSTVLVAAGGQGGTGATTNNHDGVGGTSQIGTPTGTTLFAGGNGGNGDDAAAVSGGGGGSAGPTGAGGAASGATAGNAGTGTFLDGSTRQSIGAAGRTTTANPGIAGGNYGAGGSGGLALASANRAGGAGAPGIVVLTWADTPITPAVAPSETLHCTDVLTQPELIEQGTGLSRDVPAENLGISDTATPALQLAAESSENLKLDDIGQGATQLLGVVHVVDVLTQPELIEQGAQNLEREVAAENLKLTDTATPALDLSALATDESVHVTESAEPALIDEGALSRNIDAESLHLTESAEPTLTTEGELSINVDPESLKLDDIGQGATQLVGVIHITDGPALATMGEPGALDSGLLTESLTLADAVDSYAELLTDEYLRLTDGQVIISLRTYLLVTEESLKLSDTATPALHLVATVTDSLKVTDTATPALELSAVVTESVHVTESPEAVIADEGTLTINIPAENLKLSAVSLSDISVIEAGLLTEALTLTDDPALAMRIEPDALSRAVPDDSLKISDTATAELQLAASVSDALKVSDAADAALEFTVSASESLKLSDSAQAEMQRLVSVSESLKLADEAFAVRLDAGTIAALLQEPLKLADAASVTLNPLRTSASEGLKLSDSATAALTLAATAPAENLNLADGPALTDLIAVDTQTVSAQESIRISEALTASFDVLETSPSETLKLTDTISRQIAGATSVIELTGTYVAVIEFEGTYVPAIELTGTVEL